jgi:hypothetical protein
MPLTGGESQTRMTPLESLLAERIEPGNLPHSLPASSVGGLDGRRELASNRKQQSNSTLKHTVTLELCNLRHHNFT